MRPCQKQAHGGKPSAMRWGKWKAKQVQLTFLKAIFSIAQSSHFSHIVDEHVKMYFLLFSMFFFLFFKF